MLLVEDEADTLKLLTIVLSECGAKVTPAACVTEALAAMECLMPDVIVSDIAMPDADGFEFIRRLRSLAPERGGKTPAAALTAYAHSDDAARALAAGFEAHVAKPCEPAILARVVADLAGRKSAA